MPFQSTERPLHVPKAPAPALQSGPGESPSLHSSPRILPSTALVRKYSF